MADTECKICGKPLEDPNSVEIGIGPVCRAKLKNKEINNLTENMFHPRASYRYWFVKKLNLFAIVDLGSGKTVTNDIENVLTDIKVQTGYDLTEKTIIYKDSYGAWDGVEYNGTINFYSIGVSDYQDALGKVKRSAKRKMKQLEKEEIEK